MKTDSHLTRAYKKAKIVDIDENSNYIFFSDCHRGDGSLSDEFARNKTVYQFALEYYFKKGFVYVEAGDGDELWEHGRVRDIIRANLDVYEVIKKFFSRNRLILLYGNHNIYLKKKEYVAKNYFSYFDEYNETEFDLLRGVEPCEALVLRYKKTGQEILAVHGHQGDFGNDQFWHLSMLSLKYFWRFLHAFGFQNPASPVKNVAKRHKIEKNFCKWIEENKIMLICGHTHRPKFPRSTDLPYFNTGCCIFPSSITGMEITSGNIQYVRWRMSANFEGVLRMERTVIRGPEPLEKFDIR